MPIYEYECGACGHQFEEWQKISDPPVKKCPSCAKRRVKKLVSVSAFHLKGGGWYADLYSSQGAKNAGNAAATNKGNGKSKSDSKSGSDSGSKSPSKTKAPSSASSSSSGKSSSAAAKS